MLINTRNNWFNPVKNYSIKQARNVSALRHPCLYCVRIRPDQPLAAFNGKTGAAANGNWRLFVVDNAGADVGNIECVTVNIDGYAATSAGCSAPQGDDLFANGFEDPVP